MQFSVKMNERPRILVTDEMLGAALSQLREATVHRTKASRIDTLTGILGEFAIAEFVFGDWKRNFVGQNKGASDFPDLEVKTSAFPFRENLHLLVREDYAQRRAPRFYAQVVLDVAKPNASFVPANTFAILCGWAYHAEVIEAPLKDMGSKLGTAGGYRCHYIPLAKLHPMQNFSEVYG